MCHSSAGMCIRGNINIEDPSSNCENHYPSMPSLIHVLEWMELAVTWSSPGHTAQKLDLLEVHPCAVLASAGRQLWPVWFELAPSPSPAASAARALPTSVQHAINRGCPPSSHLMLKNLGLKRAHVTDICQNLVFKKQKSIG